jgi:hypothetical protein
MNFRILLSKSVSNFGERDKQQLTGTNSKQG